MFLIGCATKVSCGKSEFCAVAPYLTITNEELTCKDKNGNKSKYCLTDETKWQIYDYDQIYYKLCIKDK